MVVVIEAFVACAPEEPSVGEGDAVVVAHTIGDTGSGLEARQCLPQFFVVFVVDAQFVVIDGVGIGEVGKPRPVHP